MPVKWARFLIQDVIHGDAAKQEIQILNQTLKKKDEYIAKQDTVITVYRKKVVMYEATMDQYTQVDSLNQKSISTLQLGNSRLKRQRNAFGFFAIASLVASFILK